MKNLKISIRELAQKGEKLTSTTLSRLFGVSRQYIAVILRSLVEDGTLLKIGKTRSAFYIAPQFLDTTTGLGITKRLKNTNLKEHEVLEDITNEFTIIKKLPESIRSIFDYGFSEMLNNAIEHSTSATIETLVRHHNDTLEFIVNDVGIGIFKNIMQKRHLNSELEAIQDLLKGKTTTQPQAHSGEGIFFTSKSADVFIIESFTYRLKIDNTLPDIFIEEQKPAKRGTRITFRINTKSQKHLSDIFKRFQVDPNTFAFNRTEVKVKLYTIGTIHISRSQARRILSGLEKFKSVILDFDKVTTVGQAFADEIFRVFKIKHSDIIITPIAMSEAVRFMIERVEKPDFTPS